MKSVRQLRREMELTQAELAKKLGVDQTYISKLELGIVPFADGVLQMKLSEALGVPLSEISPEHVSCFKHFPTLVHGKIVYNISEFVTAIKKNAEKCKGCKRLYQDMQKAMSKALR